VPSYVHNQLLTAGGMDCLAKCNATRGGGTPPVGHTHTFIQCTPHYHTDMRWPGARHMSTHNNNLANPPGPRSSCVHTKGCPNALQARLRRCSCCDNSTNCKVLSNSCGHSK
jgi:hypothetical protein